MARSNWISLLLLTGGLSSIAGIQYPSALETIQDANKKILAIYAGTPQIDHAAKSEIVRIMEEVTDLDHISRSTIQHFCQDLTSQQCQDFHRLFKQLLRASSMHKLGLYRADRFEYLGEEATGRTAVVKTIAYYKDDFMTLDYHMELQEGGWKIINYITDDVDTIRNYRKQFRRLFAENSHQEVMKRLEDKIAELEEEGGS